MSGGCPSPRRLLWLSCARRRALGVIVTVVGRGATRALVAKKKTSTRSLMAKGPRWTRAIGHSDSASLADLLRLRVAPFRFCGFVFFVFCFRRDRASPRAAGRALFPLGWLGPLPPWPGPTPPPALSPPSQYPCPHNPRPHILF